MIRLGITGQAGFIGTHLYSLAGTRPDTFERVPFEDAFFEDEAKLRAFVRSCDAIVHLAAVNRHPDPQVLYETNIALVDKLIRAMEAEQVTPHVLFASSTQEARENLYGASKRAGRALLDAWARRSGAKFTGCIIPNVFGPYGRPGYNSVVATFCHQLTHGEMPHIDVDGELRLIYVGDLCQTFLKLIEEGKDALEFRVPYTGTRKVSELLAAFKRYTRDYFAKGILPALPTPLDLQLFNTYRGYIDQTTFFPFPLEPHTDPRGSFVEVARITGLGGQFSFSTTHPGITRGNHYHTRKIERFAVIQGRARIELRRIGTAEKLSFELDGARPAFVDMPVWYTHNITNIGSDELLTLFWINEPYNPENPDTYFEEV